MVDFLNFGSPMMPAFSGPAAPVGQIMLAPVAKDVLSAINRHTPVDVVETATDADGNWFRFHTDQLNDEALYQRLSNNWAAIGGRNRLEFSLIYCRSGQGAGVWLCHRSITCNPQFLRGCQQIISW